MEEKVAARVFSLCIIQLVICLTEGNCQPLWPATALELACVSGADLKLTAIPSRSQGLCKVDDRQNKIIMSTSPTEFSRILYSVRGP